MNGWHADDAQLAAFGDGTLESVAAASVELHVVACTQCQRALRHLREGAAVDAEDQVWLGITARIDRPSRDWHGRWWLQATIGTPSLGWAAVALFLALVIVPMVAAGSPRAAAAVLFAVAPLAPILGAVLAYRADTDPAGELASATPLASARLVLLRAAVVLAVATPVGIAVSALLPVPLHLVLGWLVPGFALCAVVLACAARVDPTRLAGALAIGWALAVVLAFARTRDLPLSLALERIFVNQPLTQVAFGVLAAVAASIIVARRDDIRPWSNA